MVQIHNSDLFRELREGSRNQELRDGSLPNQIAEKVVPVMEVNPKLLRRINLTKSASKTSTGSSTVLTTDSTKDTFITNLIFSVVKDATCDIAIGGIAVTAKPKNSTDQTIISIAGLTTTAQNQTVAIDFPTPMEIEKGTAIAIAANTYTVGLMCRSLSIFGYTIDNSQA